MHLQQHPLTRLRAWQGHRASLCPWSEVMASAGLVASSCAQPRAGAGEAGAQPHAKRAAGRASCRFLLRALPVAHLMPPALPEAHVFLLRGGDGQLQGSDGPGSLLLPTYPSSSLLEPGTRPLWPCQLWVTVDGPVTPFGGVACMESGLGLVPSSVLR